VAGRLQHAQQPQTAQRAQIASVEHAEDRGKARDEIDQRKGPGQIANSRRN
jgi:hypothetical protein